jgi:valyl-tRNA synthetase
MSSAYDHHLVESKWYKFWKENGFFKADNHSKKEPYTIILPPPNVTGRLHMGHALGGTVQDTLIRYKRMKGYEVLWLPGLDHAGISTQTVVEKHLIKLTGKTRKEFDRETFLSHIWEWKEEHEKHICSQLEMIGASLDWSRKRFTMDEGSNKAVRTIFKKLYDDKLIYRGDYLVNWDPVTQTALADDEVEYEENLGSIWSINYPIDGMDATITVATTRPETLLGDTAIAVHPSDERYQHLIGKFAIVPLAERKIPIIADPFVDPTFGTGAVKITPAHDFNDYEMGLRNNLPMINIMEKDGRLNEEGKDFRGLLMQEARPLIVERLKAMDLLVKVDSHTNRIGKSYRSKAIIEPFLSKQWFVKMTHFKQDLINIVKNEEVKLVPAHFDKTYFHWIENLRDWCISRQLWWGHRIPVWYHIYDESIVICYDGEGLPEAVKKEPHLYKQDDDVLDTWFSSALWPFSTLGWPDKTADLKKFFPTSVLVTGHDILFFWVARMILMSHYALDAVPFHETYIHGLIYGKSYWRTGKDGGIQYVSHEERNSYEMGEKIPSDVLSKWEKMSKSKGNIIDPLEMIELYGADAVRMALCASLTESRQIDLDRRRFEEYKNFANKLWNASRFVMMNLKELGDDDALSSEDFKTPIKKDHLLLDDRWILSKMSRVIMDAESAIKAYDFDLYVQKIYVFLWDEFCAYYLETSKPYLSKRVDDAIIYKNKQKIVLIVLLNVLRLLHPVTPFITEELFQLLKERFSCDVEPIKDSLLHDLQTALSKEACIVAPYPHADEKWIDQEAEDAFHQIGELIYAIRNLRGLLQIPPGQTVEVHLQDLGDKHFYNNALKNEVLIKSLVKIEPFIHEAKTSSHSAFERVGHLNVIVYLPQALVEKEKERLAKEKEKVISQLAGLLKQMENADFIERAPKALVDKTKDSIAVLEGKLKDIESKLI